MSKDTEPYDDLLAYIEQIRSSGNLPEISVAAFYETALNLSLQAVFNGRAITPANCDRVQAQFPVIQVLMAIDMTDDLAVEAFFETHDLEAEAPPENDLTAQIIYANLTASLMFGQLQRMADQNIHGLAPIIIQMFELTPKIPGH